MKNTNTAVLEPVYKFICEWCEPSDTPALAPNTCRILRCNKCGGGTTWHWPKEITDPTERQTAVTFIGRQAERLRMNELIAKEMRRVEREREYIRAFPHIVSLWGLMAQHIQPQPAVTKIRTEPPGQTFVREFELTEEEIAAWPDAPVSEAIEVKERFIRLKCLPLACEGSGTILDGMRVNVWHGYSPDSNTTYYWTEGI